MITKMVKTFPVDRIEALIHFLKSATLTIGKTKCPQYFTSHFVIYFTDRHLDWRVFINISNVWLLC